MKWKQVKSLLVMMGRSQIRKWEESGKDQYVRQGGGYVGGRGVSLGVGCGLNFESGRSPVRSEGTDEEVGGVKVGR